MKGKAKKISRRKFVVRSLLGGGGILLGTVILARNPLRRALYGVLENPKNLTYLGDISDPMLWFEIRPELPIILHSPKVEMGQGTFTGMVQLAADELEVRPDQILIKHAESASGNIDGLSTGGSTSIAGFWQPLRELSATLREMLRTEAGKKLGVATADIRLEEGVASAGLKSLPYGQIAQGVTEWEIPETPALKEIKDYKFIGKPVPRVDLEAKVMGEPIFGMDAVLPGMLYGAVVQPDKVGVVFGGAEITQAEKMPGVVKVVVEDDFVGVVANSYTEAEAAKAAIKVDWKREREWTTADIKSAIQIGKGDKMLIQKEGRPGGILEDAKDDSSLITATYSSPLGAHAQLEPNGAVASVEGGKATVILSTQVVKLTRKEVADRLGFKEEDVNIVPTYLGGGFGRRLHTPNAVHAAVLSRAVGKPVKCFLNRKEEFQKDTFRPPTQHQLSAKLSEAGSIEAIEHQFASSDVMFNAALLPGFLSTIVGSDIGTMRGGRIQYSGIPNYRAISWHCELPFATSWWRSLGLLANTFAIESFMDELAVAAGKDPIAFHLDHIADNEEGKRLKNVITAVRDLAAFRDSARDGRAMGFACSTDAGTPVAMVAEVRMEGKEIRVDKAWMAIDPGFAVNPDQVRAQCEGCIIMGISAAMYEEMRVEDSELKPIIYGPYRMAQMKHSPKEIEVEIINGTGKPGAVGEPPLGPVGAAIANAVFRLTGQRLREMPLARG
ncbi:isoquinoline 1-oxidoreductase, beta subunit [Robiginitalea myxolifaciens]|uniref:Isoquinoline 1-oxidoreductase, beta subunit n=1 Tax=Robiginitalea myxolifaciens TaxID=400055 RepID=A0A1I6GCB0_9FLAO|nr:molybdopterin cofactor-binding domain-containing protein [Robiginitalea myxolifaciens]SFR39825.1 isoquinoline 1-oxidoreductase, beta subunit [Robiginitalea myxolifaciens]